MTYQLFETPGDHVERGGSAASADGEHLVRAVLDFAGRLAAAHDVDAVLRATAEVLRTFGVVRMAVAIPSAGQWTVRWLDDLRDTGMHLVEEHQNGRVQRPHDRRALRSTLVPDLEEWAAGTSGSVLPLRTDDGADWMLITDEVDARGSDILHRLQLVANATATALRRVAEAGGAARDPLTGAVSRIAFEITLARALSERSGRLVGVVSCDLDRFRRVNEGLGHLAGDELLQLTAQRLLLAAGPEGIVARLGGDEFVVAFTDLASEEEAELRLHALDAALRPPVDLLGQVFYPTASFGCAIARSDVDGDGPALTLEVLRAAEASMQAAKDHVHNRPPAGAAFDLLHLDADLHAAVLHGDLLAHFQPLYDLATGRLCGFEALARWPHEQLGFIPPDVFIALAEDNGLIHTIGDQMLAMSRQFLAAQPDPETRLSVNASTKQVSVPGFARRVASVFGDDARQLGRLTIELTESALILDQDLVLRELHELRELGVGIAIDDFGSGYSSLSQLQELPVTELKIDRTFVQRAGIIGREVVEAVMQLAAGLGLTVVAEGVELPAQLQMLRSVGCDRAQGFLFSPPLPADLALALPRMGSEVMTD